VVHSDRLRRRRVSRRGRFGVVRIGSIPAALPAITGEVTGSSAVEAGHSPSRSLSVGSSGANVSTRLVVHRPGGMALQLAELAVDLALHLALPTPLVVPLRRQEAVQLLLQPGTEVGLLRRPDLVRRASPVVGFPGLLIRLQT